MPTAGVVSPGRLAKPSSMVIGAYVGYAAVGWFLSGLGSVLPALEAQLGQRSALFQLFPGAVLLFGGLVMARRQRSRGITYRPRDLGVGVAILAVGVAVMGATRWFVIGTIGALLTSVAAAALIRMLPAMFAIECPDDTERVMVRANAWSSLAAIAGPIAIGASIGAGIGWLPGMELLLVASAAIIPIFTRTDPAPVASPDAAVDAPSDAGGGPTRSDGKSPPLSRWWVAWVLLWLSIVLEFSFAYYASTYLHDTIGLSTAAAASGTAAWAIGMTAGRFATSAWRAPASMVPSAALVLAGFALLWAVATPVAAIAGFGLAGVGASPLFPTKAAALLDRFKSAPNEGSTYAAIASGAALLGAPALMASLRSLFDVRVAYLIVPVIVALLLVFDRIARAPATDAHGPTSRSGTDNTLALPPT